MNDGEFIDIHQFESEEDYDDVVDVKEIQNSSTTNKIIENDDELFQKQLQIAMKISLEENKKYLIFLKQFLFF